VASTFQKLSKSTAILSGANAVQAAAAFALLPVYTRYLTPADYGLAELLITSITLSTIVTGQGIPSAVSRRLNFVYRDDNNAKKTSVSTAIAYLFFCGIVFCGVVALFSTAVSSAVMDSPQYENLVLVGLVVTLVRGAGSVCEITLRAHFQATSVAVVHLTSFLTRAGLILYLLVVSNWGFQSLVYGLAASEFVSVGLSLFLVRRYLALRFSTKELRAMLAYGLPLLGSAGSFFILSLSNRYFLNYMTGPTEVGLYSIADRLANALNLLIFVPLLAFLPAAYFEIASRESSSAPGQFARFATQFVAGGALLVSGMLLFADVVIANLFTKAYHDSAAAVGILAFGYFLFAASDLSKLGLLITGKTLWLPIPVACAALANVGLNLVLIPDFGFRGAALATTVSYGILWFVGLRLAQRQYPVPYEVRKITIVAFGGIMLLAGYVGTAELSDLPRFGVRLLMMLAYGAFLLLTRTLEPTVLIRVIRSSRSGKPDKAAP
jgi:O-antigen/teichoic acid export membrane protein